MIKVEIITIGDKQYTRTYSDEHRYVVRESIEYDEAIDPIDSDREYTEGDIMLTDDNGEISAEEFLSMVEEVL